MASVVMFVVVVAQAGLSRQLELRNTAMYGMTAVLRGARQEITVALPEGGRVVSWKIDGREIGFVGRIWGGDMSDSLALDGVSAGLRFHPPAVVAVLRIPTAVAVRVSMNVITDITT